MKRRRSRGRPRIVDRKSVKALAAGGDLYVTEIAEKIGCHRRTVHRILRRKARAR